MNYQEILQCQVRRQDSKSHEPQSRLLKLGGGEREYLQVPAADQMLVCESFSPVKAGPEGLPPPAAEHPFVVAVLTTFPAAPYVSAHWLIWQL